MEWLGEDQVRNALLQGKGNTKQEFLYTVSLPPPNFSRRWTGFRPLPTFQGSLSEFLTPDDVVDRNVENIQAASLAMTSARILVAVLI